MEFATRLSPDTALEKLSVRQPTAIGEANGAWAGLTFAGAGGNGGETRAGESDSATLRGRRHVLDRNVRLRMRLQRVVAMMPIMLVMAAHLGIGVQRLRFALLRLDDRRLRALVHRSLNGLVRRCLRG